jgi:hypothetical protein
MLIRKLKELKQTTERERGGGERIRNATVYNILSCRQK